MQQLFISSYIALSLLFQFFEVTAQRPERLQPLSKVRIQVPEPSGIFLKPDSDNFFIASDKGYLYETDAKGKIIRKANFVGYDFEGVTVVDGHSVVVVDERTRKVHFFDIERLEMYKSVEIPYHGTRNLSYESIAYLGDDLFVLIVEKRPVWYRIVKIPRDGVAGIVHEVDISHLASDISDAFYHEGKMWLLSDEDSEIILLDAESLEENGRWRIPVLNPEGICMNNAGQIVIVSDIEHHLYIFENPLKQ